MERSSRRREGFAQWIPVIFGVSVLVGLGSCGREADYLYLHAKHEPAGFVGKDYKVQDLKGSTSQFDVLWVIDNSGSMSSYQNAVIQNAVLFMNEFIKKPWLDYKIGLVSTDSADQPYDGFSMPFQTGEPNPVGRFQTAVSRLGISGSGFEKPIECANNALMRYPTFSRTASELAVIFVTDAPDQSNISAQTFLANLKTIKNGVGGVKFYPVLAASDLGCSTQDDPNMYAGSPYEELVKAMGGKPYKLCDPQFGKLLADLAQQIFNVEQKPKLYLSDRPKTSSLKVTYKGQILPGGPKEAGGFWQYDYWSNAIAFHDLKFIDPVSTQFVRVEFFADDGLP